MARIESLNLFINNMWLINIYKQHLYCEDISILKLEQSTDFGELLTPPIVVNKLGWSRGYFYTISNIPVTQSEKEIDYGNEKSATPTPPTPTHSATAASTMMRKRAPTTYGLDTMIRQLGGLRRRIQFAMG